MIWWMVCLRWPQLSGNGGIPLVSVHKNASGDFTIRVRRATATSQFTAISHVWSDGLGNKHSNVLLQCQLISLAKCRSRLLSDGDRAIYYEEGEEDRTGTISITSLGLDQSTSPKRHRPRLFWTDTLCISVDEQYSELKTKAINKMDAIYAQAREVLVRDSEIRGLNIKTTHPREMLALIAYSSWAGRCWTLQEGAIGRVCYFQCAEGALILDKPSKTIGKLRGGSPLELLLYASRRYISYTRHQFWFTEYSISRRSPNRTRIG